jgi:dTDP-glucose 4,6-dehydratase
MPDRSILITGGAGFIASHLAHYLRARYPNYRVVILDRMDYCSHVGNVPDSVTLVIGDILDTELVQRLIRQYEIDTILHFAAQSHVDSSIQNPLEHTKVNCLGTQHLLEAARSCADQIRLFVHVSTDEVYGGSGVDLDENTPFNPTNPYSASKAAAECIVNAYWKTYKLPLIVTRANNIYGPCQFPEKVIPKFIFRLLRGKRCCLHGGGRTERHYLHVEDICAAYDAIIHRGKLGQVYNIGSDYQTSIIELARKIVKELMWLGKLDDTRPVDDYLEIASDRAFNDQRYDINDERIRAELGWQPEISLDVGLARTVRWYVEHTDYWGDSIEPYLEPHPVYTEKTSK